MKKLLAILCLFGSMVLIAVLMKINMTGISPEYTNENKTASNSSISKTLSEMKEGFDDLSKDIDKETMNDVMDYVKEKSSDGSLNSKEGIKEAIKEAESRYDFSVSDNTKEKIADAVDKLESMGFSTESIVDKTDKLYDKYGADFVDHMEEAFVEAAKDAAEDAAQNAWDNMKNGAKELISGIVY